MSCSSTSFFAFPKRLKVRGKYTAEGGRLSFTWMYPARLGTSSNPKEVLGRPGLGGFLFTLSRGTILGTTLFILPLADISHEGGFG